MNKDILFKSLKVIREGIHWFFWEIPTYLDRWRVVARGMMALYGWLCVETYWWFTAISEPNNAQSVFSSAIIAAGAAWFGLYIKGDDQPTTNTKK